MDALDLKGLHVPYVINDLVGDAAIVLQDVVVVCAGGFCNLFDDRLSRRVLAILSTNA